MSNPAQTREVGGPAIVTGPPVAAVPRRFSGTVWPAFLVRRAVSLGLTATALVVVSFLVVQLIPGDPAVAVAGPDATQEEVAAVRSQLGLDRPLVAQFVQFVGSVLHADLGTSFVYRQPVSLIIENRLPYTLGLAAPAILLSLLVSVPLGTTVGVATRGGRRRWLDAGFGAVTGFVDSVPGYITATVLVVLFGFGIGVFPSSPPAYTDRAPVPSYLLPVLALSVGPVCTLARVVRREMGVVLDQDHMRTARGWRLPARTRYLEWGLPNLLTTTLTLGGLVLTSMVGGAVVIETVFAIPGLGTGIVKAILDRDYPVIQGMVIVIGMMAALVNFAVDVLLGLVDRRTLGGHHGH